MNKIHQVLCINDVDTMSSGTSVVYILYLEVLYYTGRHGESFSRETRMDESVAVHSLMPSPEAPEARSIFIPGIMPEDELSSKHTLRKPMPEVVEILARAIYLPSARYHTWCLVHTNMMVFFVGLQGHNPVTTCTHRRP